MNRTPLNTAIFLYDLVNEQSSSAYLDFMRIIIKQIQNKGYEPYVYSNNEQLLEEANLIIKRETDHIVNETQPFWKEHNLILLPTVDVENDLDLILSDSHLLQLFERNNRSIGFLFAGKDVDWLSILLFCTLEKQHKDSDTEESCPPTTL